MLIWLGLYHADLGGRFVPFENGKRGHPYKRVVGRAVGTRNYWWETPDSLSIEGGQWKIFYVLELENGILSGSRGLVILRHAINNVIHQLREGNRGLGRAVGMFGGGDLKDCSHPTCFI